MERSPAHTITFALIVLLAGCRSGTTDNATGKFLERGKQYAQQKDYARAVLQFRNEAQLLPNSPEAYYQMGLAYLEMRNGRAAYAHFKKAVEVDPNHTEAQIKLAELTALNPNKELRQQAEARAKDVLERTPGNPDALTVLALTEIAGGDEKDAESRLLSALSTAPTHLKSAVMLAALKIRNKDFDGAEAVLKSVTERDPKSADAALALGRFYVMTRRPDDAAREYGRAVQFQPTNAAALLSLAQLQVATGKPAEAEQTLRRLSALPDKEYRTTHAMFLYASGNRDAAVAELQDLHQKDPTDRNSRTLLVRVYLMANRESDAQKVLEKALQQNPKDVDALLERATLHLNAGRYTEAQNDLARVLQFAPDSGDAHRQLARLHRARGDRLQVRQELIETLRLNPQKLDARLELADDLLNARRIPAALELLDNAPENQRQSIPVLAARGRTLVAGRRFAEARATVDEGLKQSRTRNLLLVDSQLRLAQNDYAGARGVSEEILKAFPEDVAALENVAYAYFREKRGDLALKRIRDQAALKPGSARLQYFLALQLIANRRSAEARPALKAALQADPSFFPATLELAKMDIGEGRIAEARQELTPLLSSKLTETPARLLLAQADINTANPVAAIEHYRRILMTDPHNVFALNNAASLLADQPNGADEALKYAQQVKELVPEDPHVDDTLGWVFYRKGIYKTAVQYLEAATAKQPSPAVQYHLAMAYFRSGDTVKARRTLQSALKLDPNAPGAAAASELISQR